MDRFSRAYAGQLSGNLSELPALLLVLHLTVNVNRDYTDYDLVGLFFVAERLEFGLIIGAFRDLSLLLYVIKDEARWKLFAAKVKGDNLRKPAFQEEFGRVITEWGELVPA